MPKAVNSMGFGISLGTPQGTEVEDRGEASKEDKAAAAKSGEEIYIGFEKGDYGPRKGRKGRVLKDDPSR